MLGLTMLATLAPLCGADTPTEAPTEQQVTWIPLSQLFAELSQNREFVEALLDRLGKAPRAGGILGPEQIKKFREHVLGKDWEALDHFPTLTVDGMVRAMRLAAEQRTLETPAPVGSVAGRRPLEEPLGLPTRAPPPGAGLFLKPAGFGLEIGDRTDPALAALYPDGQRLADVLNRLALNAPADADGAYGVIHGARRATSPRELIALLVESGHALEIRDGRYFANFGDLIFKGRDVLSPFWVDTGIVVPGEGRTLRVPVGHAQHELWIRGPVVNAALSFYFGIDGKALFRPMAERNQSWVLGRVARSYRHAEALEVVRLQGDIIRTYRDVQRAHPDLPFGGYMALGVCNDVNAMVELHMTGRTTLFPLTHDPALFPADTEVGRLARRLPVDSAASPYPELSRVLGSIPVARIADLPLPAVRADLERVTAAEARGQIQYAVPGSPWLKAIAAGLWIWRYRERIVGGAVGVAALLALAWWMTRRATPAPGATGRE
jgi:hypothetical protein